MVDKRARRCALSDNMVVNEQVQCKFTLISETRKSIFSIVLVGYNYMLKSVSNDLFALHAEQCISGILKKKEKDEHESKQYTWCIELQEFGLPNYGMLI
ncbi:hypothetical protein EWB00_004425 [Schistosoma japonicum]|uniref:Uncharacterized protein n=1 Tax=Schistosoma japonicum TaxID=6182 RepID=A0A4Z2D5A6_SCHJA|nr:hypothetical protein EWB00_004425 [Schistosoma japonicum]